VTWRFWSHAWWPAPAVVKSSSVSNCEIRNQGVVARDIVAGISGKENNQCRKYWGYGKKILIWRVVFLGLKRYGE
jgi:hypothetical protein